MNVKISETKTDTYRNCSVKGMLFNIYMKHGTANTAILAADFVASSVLVKCVLHRNKGETHICANNLKILGLYSSINYGQHAWERGNIITYPAGGIFSDKLISLFLDFGGVINVKEDDELFVEVTLGANAFSANINTGVSYVEFNPEFGCGYEMFTPRIQSKVLAAGENSQKFTLGDNVVKLAFLNFDVDNISSPVIISAGISSVQYSASLSFYDLLNRHWNSFATPVVNWRYGNTQPVTSGNEALPYLPKYPQSVMLFVGTKDNTLELDNCMLDLNVNAATVVASQNFVVCTSAVVTRQLVERAKRREEKHLVEKLSSIPVR